MTKALKLLMVSPAGPPKNAPEALQVRRLLQQLDLHLTGDWVSTPAGRYGWVQAETALVYTPKNLQRMDLRFPGGELAMRLFHSRLGKPLHRPDASAWVIPLSSQVTRKLRATPDVIYSRSFPRSSSLLASRLAQKLGRPWVMHLSDPWASDESDKWSLRQEALCVERASRISLTTQGQVEIYKARYRDYADKFFVSPNMYPSSDESKGLRYNAPKKDQPLRLIYAGALYEPRRIAPLVKALKQLCVSAPELLHHLRIDIYGNADEENLRALHSAPALLHYHGHVDYRQARQLQCNADIVLNIDMQSLLPAHQHYLPSKMLDAMAMGKPQLCLTQPNSTIAHMCAQGFGWAIAPANTQALCDQLERLIVQHKAHQSIEVPSLPEQYHANAVAEALMAQFYAAIHEWNVR